MRRWGGHTDEVHVGMVGGLVGAALSEEVSFGLRQRSGGWAFWLAQYDFLYHKSAFLTFCFPNGAAWRPPLLTGMGKRTEGTGGRKMRCFTVMEPVMSQPGGTRRIGLRERPGDNIPAGFLSASRMDEWNMGCQLWRSSLHSFGGTSVVAAAVALLLGRGDLCGRFGNRFQMSSVLTGVWKQLLGLFFFFCNSTDRIKKDWTSSFSEYDPQTSCPRIPGELVKMQILSPNFRQIDQNLWEIDPRTAHFIDSFPPPPMIHMFIKAQEALL